MEQFSGKWTLGFGFCLGSEGWGVSWPLTPPEMCGWCPRLHTAGVAEAFVSPRALPRGTWSLLLRLAAGHGCVLQSCSGRTSLRRMPGSPFLCHRCPVGLLCAGLSAARGIFSQPSKILQAEFLGWWFLCCPHVCSPELLGAGSSEWASWSDCIHLCV